MKTFIKPAHAAILIIFLIFSCDKPERIQEVPDNIIPSKPCPTLFGSIMDRFRENKNNQQLHNNLFIQEIEKRIILTKESELYITFISEGAGYANSLGWYAYDGNRPPRGPGDIKKNLLFPHISDEILKQGDMLQLGEGKFAAGTVVGFFLVIRGWQNGRVDYNKPTFYTDVSWNPNGLQQHILFRESECSDIVLAFEDKTPEEGSDLDYNDVIFTISDNANQLQNTAIALEKVPDL
jgi:hypothetical protein